VYTDYIFNENTSMRAILVPNFLFQKTVMQEEHFQFQGRVSPIGPKYRVSESSEEETGGIATV
jgi:hypothetical protein